MLREGEIIVDSFAGGGGASTGIEMALGRFDIAIEGKPITKTAQIRMCGNSVCPDMAAALVRANFADGLKPRVDIGEREAPMEMPLWGDAA